MKKKLSIASVFLGDERGKNLWIYIKDADRLRLNTFVENYPTDYFDSIEYILENENSPLYLSAAIRAKKLLKLKSLIASGWKPPSK